MSKVWLTHLVGAPVQDSVSKNGVLTVQDAVMIMDIAASSNSKAVSAIGCGRDQ